MLSNTEIIPSFGCLVIVVGAPYHKGTCLSLPHKKVILGRSTSVFAPDISFDSLLISRKHCCIEPHGDIWTITDLGSKHGTLLNDKPLQKFTSFQLKHGDKINLATGVISLHFTWITESELTLDYTNTLSLNTVITSKPPLPIVVDTAKKTLFINDAEVSLSIKEWHLLELLYLHKNTLVSYQAIRSAVWAERYNPHEKFPEVGFEEINILLYRLRRKLGAYSDTLKTRRGQGCILEID